MEAPVEDAKPSTPASTKEKKESRPKSSSAKVAMTPETPRKVVIEAKPADLEHPDVEVSENSAPPSPPPLQPVEPSADSETSAIMPRAEQTELMRVYARWIFDKADDDHDACLNEWEFMSLVQSPTLGLKISDQEAHEMMQDFCEDPRVGLTFSQFIPMLKDLMMRQSLAKQERNKSEWQWFIMHFDDLPVYYNTIDDTMTYTKPAGVSDERDLQVQDFESITVNGMGCLVAVSCCHFLCCVSDLHLSSLELPPHRKQELTTFVNEKGFRMYLDFETSQWKPFPAEWYDDVQVESVLEESDGPVGATLDRLEQSTIPDTGFSFESYVENGVRFYFNEDAKEWAAIPVALELWVPRVIEQLAALKARFPSWRSRKEQLLALRQHHYELDDVIAWKEKEDEFAAKFGVEEEPHRSTLSSAKASKKDDQDNEIHAVASEDSLQVASQLDFGRKESVFQTVRLLTHVIS